MSGFGRELAEGAAPPEFDPVTVTGADGGTAAGVDFDTRPGSTTTPANSKSKIAVAAQIHLGGPAEGRAGAAAGTAACAVSIGGLVTSLRTAGAVLAAEFSATGVTSAA